MKLILGSLNILSPYYAIKWLISSGLHPLAYTQTKRILRKSLRGSDKYAWKKYSNWEKRFPIIADHITKADVMCIQEVSNETLDDITKLTHGYQVALLACHTSRDPISQYGNAILYNPQKLTLISTFEVKYATNTIQRAACCAIFTCEDKRILISSVHLRGYDPDQAEGDFKEASKKTGYNELGTYVEEIEKKGHEMDVIAIAGDFNEAPEGKKMSLSRLKYLEDRNYVTDNNLVSTEVESDRKIDWIFFKLNDDKIKLSPMDFEKLTSVSDHLMTGTRIEW